MANTRRKTIDPIANGLEGNGLCSERSKNNIVEYLECQDTFGNSLEPLEFIVPPIAKVAATATTLHVRWSGSTVGINCGSMVGHPRFAVSIYPERSADLTVLPTCKLLFAFMAINADVLLSLDHALGNWFDEDWNLHVLDLVVCPSSIAEATHLGKFHNQKAIFDLQARRGILLAGFSDIDLGEVRR